MNSQRGQLAIGLAVAFTGGLLMFSMVLKSAQLIQEKIQLQQSTDRAALVAADAQKHALNQIRLANAAIEVLAEKLEMDLKRSYCKDDHKWSRGIQLSQLIANTKTPGVDCNTSCNGYDEKKKKDAIDEFKSRRSRIASLVSAINLNGNRSAFQKAVEIFFNDFQILPAGLQRWINDKFHTALSKSELVDKYQDGTFSEHIRLKHLTDHSELFSSMDEKREFTSIHYYYPPSPVLFDPTACGLEVQRLPAPIPAANLPIKIIRIGQYRTSFLLEAKYSPPPIKSLKNFKLFSHEEREEDVPLLPDARAPEAQIWMSSYAMAKPFGGSFPREGRAMPWNFSSVIGEKFKGAKLAGISDQRETGGADPIGEIILPNLNYRGEALDPIRVTLEDFLH